MDKLMRSFLVITGYKDAESWDVWEEGGSGSHEGVLGFASKYRTAKTEHSIALGKDGSIIMKKAGTKRGVSFSGDECVILKDAETFVHNHPHPVPFSNQDIEFQQTLNIKRAVLVTKDARYTWEKTPKSQKLDYGVFDRDSGVMNSEYNAARTTFYHANQRFPTVDEQIDMWRPIRETQLRKIAEENGWKFTKEAV